MSSDIFVPTSKAGDALVGPLHTVSYITADKHSLEQMLCDGMDLEKSSWIQPSPEEYAQLNPYFGFDKNDRWQIATFYRTGDAQNVVIRAIHLMSDKPMVRPEVDGRYIGGATIGFPMLDMPRRKKKMASAGIKSSVGVKELEFTNAVGETYVSREIHFLGTENIFILGVQRPEVFVQIGGLDVDTKIGAAAYSCRCVKSADAINEFFSSVMGYEVRRDMTMSVGPNSGLKLEEGIQERFVQAFAPGSGTGYVVFLEHQGKGIASPAPSLGPPNRGVVMWSFQTSNLDELHRRAQTTGIEILQKPHQRNIPYFPIARTMVLNDPDGFPIEVFEV